MWGLVPASGLLIVCAINLLSDNNYLINKPEVADEFPAAEVIGVDLSPIQPGWSVFLSRFLAHFEMLIITLHRTPPNLKFIIDDANQEWDFAEESFDFIHIRSLAGCIEDWPTFLRQCYKYV